MNKALSKKPIKLTSQAAVNIAEALKAYASVAYPLGGSECSQATHQTLMELAKKITIMGPEGTLRLKKRQLPIIKATINWYYSEDNVEKIKQAINAENLLQQLER